MTGKVFSKSPMLGFVDGPGVKEQVAVTHLSHFTT